MSHLEERRASSLVRLCSVSTLRLCLIPLALAALQSFVLAQADAGRISGVVRDPNGAVVVGANVTATTSASAERFSSVRLFTDRQGGTTYTYASLQNFLAANLQSIQFTGDLSARSPFTGVSGTREARQAYYIAYAQDQWQLRPGLTLNYGLRYEYYSPLRERERAQVLFDIKTGALLDPKRAPYHSSKTNFGPRVALAWSPNATGTGFFAGGRSVLRAGFGIYYGPGQTEDQIQPIESDRIQATISGSTVVNGTQLFAFPTSPSLFADFFNSNPANRSFQPRAYAPDYQIPERVYQFSVSYQQELPGHVVATVGFVGSVGRIETMVNVGYRLMPAARVSTREGEL